MKDATSAHKIDRLATSGSISHAGHQGSNTELVLWVFVLASSLLALAYWGA